MQTKNGSYHVFVIIIFIENKKWAFNKKSFKLIPNGAAKRQNRIIMGIVVGKIQICRTIYAFVPAVFVFEWTYSQIDRKSRKNTHTNKPKSFKTNKNRYHRINFTTN